MLRLERDAWSMIKLLRQATNEHPSPHALRSLARGNLQVRAEQALLTELESEWLNQFWVQGRRHALLHPWWRGPMALVLATWRELEGRTAATVQRLLALGERLPVLKSSPSPRSIDEERGGAGVGAGRGVGVGLEPAEISKAFDTVLRALEERRESRARWGARFSDPAYRSLPRDCRPVVPAALWATGGENAGGASAVAGAPRKWDGEGPLPQSLEGVMSRLRECYTASYRAACCGKKAGSAKAIAAGAASNWELYRAASGNKQSGALQQRGATACGGGGGGKKRANVRGDRDAFQNWNDERGSGVGAGVSGGGGGGGGGGRQGPKRKGSKKRRR